MIRIALFLGAVILGLVDLRAGEWRGGAIRWAAPHPLKNLDPHISGVHHALLWQVYEALVARDPVGRLHPGPAEKWTLSADGFTWTFELRRDPDVAFHKDGALLDAKDAVYSIQRAWRINSTARSALGPISELRIVDDHTFKVTGAIPLPDLPAALADVFLVEDEWGTENLTDDEARHLTSAVGTGPYVLLTPEFGVGASLRPFENYWGTQSHDPPEGLLHFEEMRHTPVIYQSLVTGDVDFAQGLGINHLSRLENDEALHEDLQVHRIPSFRTMALGINQLHGSARDWQKTNPFHDLKVRRAVSLVIDRESIVDSLLLGFAQPTGTLASPTALGWVQELDQVLEPNVADAKSLLNEAGYPDGFATTLDCHIRQEEICDAISKMLDEIGIDVDVEARDSHYDHIRTHGSDFFSMTAFSRYSAQPLLEDMAHTRTDSIGESNFTSFSDEGIDSQIRALLGMSRMV